MFKDKRKILGSILGSLMFLVVILALTYAFYIWRGDNTLVTFNINDSYSYCEVGEERTFEGIGPVLDYRDGIYQTFVVNNAGNSDTTFSLTLEITSIDEALLSESFQYKLVADTSGGSNNCADLSNNNCVEIGTGNFANFRVGANTLFSSVSLASHSRYQYYLFLYIDGNMENDTAMRNCSMTAILDICEVVVFLDYNGGSGETEFLKVTSNYAGLPTTATRNNTVVTYQTNGGSAISNDSISYTFDGWYFEQDFQNLVTESTVVGSNINHTLYAKWVASKSITLPSSTKEGYTFSGWYSDSELVNKVGNAGDVYNPEQSITLYAKWIAAAYKVTFDVNDGDAWTSSTCTGTGISFTSSSSSCTKPVTYSSTYGTMPTPTRTGYTFVGWYTSASGGTNITSSSTVSITAPQTLYAHWTDTKVVSNVSLYSGPTKTTYLSDESINTAGIQLTLTYESGNTEIIDGTSYVTGYTTNTDNSSNVRHVITIKYDTYTLTTTTYKNGWYGAAGSTYYYYKNQEKLTGGDHYLPNTNTSTISNYFYFNSDGTMLTGWRDVGSCPVNSNVSTCWSYYLENNSGNGNADNATSLGNAGFARGSQIRSNWAHVYNGVRYWWYYFDSNGIMLANKTTTINGSSYTFDADGHCTVGNGCG